MVKDPLMAHGRLQALLTNHFLHFVPSILLLETVA